MEKRFLDCPTWSPDRSTVRAFFYGAVATQIVFLSRTKCLAHSSWSHRKWDTQISAFGSPAKRHLRATPPACLASEIIIGIALTRFWHDDPSEVSFPCQLGRKT